MDPPARSPGYRPAVADGSRQRCGFGRRRCAVTLLSFMKDGRLKRHNVAVGAPRDSSEATGGPVSPTLSAPLEFERPRPAAMRTDSHAAVMATVHQDLVA